jgi:phosphopantothenoylcysteine decarboxylase
MPNLLIGVTGSVATIKLPQLIENIVQQGRDDGVEWTVKVVATANAMHFIETNCDKGSIQTEIVTDAMEWSLWKQRNDPVLHIQLRQWADVFLIAPLDANTLAKLANGLCDNLLASISFLNSLYTTTDLKSRHALLGHGIQRSNW